VNSNTLPIRNDFLGYRPEELVGQGGMGVVYRARDLRLKRVVALKLMAPELATDERFRERFAREAELAMSLEHPNVVPIHDAGELDGRLYLVMRFVEGTDLRALLRDEGALEPRRALAIVGQVANALDAAHEKSLVHRDVKPSNVLLDAHDHAYLADFGLTRPFGSGAAGPTDGRSLGTPAYIAPEQIEGGEIDGRTDVYSLGCLLYECLTGAPPFAASSRLAVAWAHLEEEPPRASERRPELASAVNAVLARAMAKDPADRYASCGELVAAAEEALGLERRPSRRRRLLIAAAVLVLAAALAGVIASRAGGDPVSTDVARNTLVRIDPNTNRVVAVVGVGKLPGAIAVGGRSVWTYNYTDGTVSEIDAESNEVRHTTTLVMTPYLTASVGSALAADRDGAWVAGFDPVTGGSALTRILRGGETRQYRLGANAVEVVNGGGALWVLGRRGDATQLIRVNPRTGSVIRRVPLSGVTGGAHTLSFGGGRLWLVDEEAGVLYRIDPASGRSDSVDLGGYAVEPAYGMGFVWICALTKNGAEMMRVDPRTLHAEFAGKGLPAEEGGEYTAGLGSVWRLDVPSGTLMRFDPKTRDLSGLVHVLDGPLKGGMQVTSLVAGDGALWLTVA
jgi:streptogramin lyase